MNARQETRRRRQQRGSRDQRRQLLLETTLQLIGREGVDAVSHRLVAEEAGVPLGSTTYWFRSRAEMLTEALAYFARSEAEALRDRVAGLTRCSDGLEDAVDALAALVAPQLGEEDRWRTVAQYALFGEAARRPELKPVVEEWNEAWWDALQHLFAACGLAGGRLEAQMLVAMLDGLLVQQLAAPDAEFESEVLRPALRAWLGRLPRIEER